MYSLICPISVQFFYKYSVTFCRYYNLWIIFLTVHYFSLEDIKISFEDVDFYAKLSLILNTPVRNSKTQWTIVSTPSFLPASSWQELPRASNAQFLAFECNFKVAHEPTPLLSWNYLEATTANQHPQVVSISNFRLKKTTSGGGKQRAWCQKFRVKLERFHAKNQLWFA